MHFLALDIGSSFIKGAVLDAEKLTIEHVTRVPFPEPIGGLPPGHFEVDPRLVVEAVREVAQKLLAKKLDAIGVLFSSQMGGVILAKVDGHPLTNYISWRDQRTTEESSEKPGKSSLERARSLLSVSMERLGNEFRAGSALAILYQLNDELDLWAEGIPMSLGEIPMSLGDYVLQQLCQSGPKHVEPTLALGLLDLRTTDWNFQAFRALHMGLKGSDLFNLGKVWTPAGIWKVGNREIPCYPPIGDHQAALAGALLQSGELSLNISTGSQISLLTDRFAPGNYQTRPYLDGRFLNTITHLPAGRSLDVLVNLVDKPWPEIVKAAEAAPDSDLTANLAFFDGPLGSRGSISNITTENLSIGTLFRSAFRNMADNYATCAARLSPEKNWDRIVFSGGLAQKLPLLRQFILEKLPAEARLCSSAEDTLLGLLVISQVISGRAKDLQEASSLVLASQGG